MINLRYILGSHYYKINKDAHAFVRLTNNATSYFNNFPSKEKSDFYQNLVNKLAEMVPISNDRITFNSYSIEPLTQQILISIKFLKSNDNSVMDVETIIKDLDTLIRNKEYTLISKNDLTSMLDESYGLVKHSK